MGTPVIAAIAGAGSHVTCTRVVSVTICERLVRAEDKLCRAGRRRSQTVEIGRQQSVLLSEIHALHPSREAIDHFRPFENINASHDECAGDRDRHFGWPRGEHMRAHVVTIGPYPRVRVIDEVGRVSHEVVDR